MVTHIEPNQKQAMAIFTFTISWLPLLLLVSLPFLYLCLLYPKKKAQKEAKLPPSPPRFPIIGNLHQLGKLPHQSLWQLSQKYGPVMLLQLGNSPTLVISSADMAKEVLKTHDIDFCSRPPSPGAKRLSYNFSDMAFTPYGGHWREMRRIFVTGLLNSNIAQSFRQAREVEMNNLINSLLLASPNPVDLDEQIYSFMDGFFGTAALGKSYRGKQFKGQNLKDVVEEAMRMVDSFSAEDFFPWIGKMVDTLTGQRARLEKCFINLDGYFRMMLEEHLHHERPKAEYEDFVDVLVRLSKDETGLFRLTNDRMKGILLNTFLGGIDTSAVTLVWAMSEIVKNSLVMQKVQTEIRGCIGRKPKVEADDLAKLTYLKMVVKETLRLHPAAPLMIPHMCLRHCKIGSYNIPPGTRVLINVWAIGRDPKNWKNPDEFYPERFENSDIDFRGQNFEFLPFGAGRRICPGINIAIPTIEFTLANLLYCFDWKVPGEMKREDINMKEEGGITIHKKEPLSVVPIKYNWEE